MTRLELLRSAQAAAAQAASVIEVARQKKLDGQPDAQWAADVVRARTLLNLAQRDLTETFVPEYHLERD